MVYGVASIWIHKALTFEQAIVSYLALCVLLFSLVKLKDRIVRNQAPPRASALAPSHGT